MGNIIVSYMAAKQKHGPNFRIGAAVPSQGDTIEPCGSPRTLAVAGTSVAAVTTDGTRALGACPSAVRPCVCGGWFGGLWEELLPIASWH